MIHHAFRAMGTGVEAWVSDAEQVGELEGWFESVEATCSRFLPGSELTLINLSDRNDHDLSPMLHEAMVAATRARHLTQGIVDVGVGGLVAEWGYDRTFAEVSDTSAPPEDLMPPDWRLEGNRLIRTAGTRLDLGGICKGWACDRAVEMGLGFVVSAGGDLRSADAETVVSVEDPWGEIVARVMVGQGALATSSTARRRWQVAGREVSHVIDPRTLAPVRTPVLTATVVAETAVDAEAGAKTVLVLGEDGLAWADEAPWVQSALVVWADGSVFGTRGLELAA